MRMQMNVNGFEFMMNGQGMGDDINLAELDTRTFHRPADPEVVAALPVVPMRQPGEFTFSVLSLPVVNSFPLR